MKNKSLFFFSWSIFIYCTIANSSGNPESFTNPWYPIIGISGGVLSTSNMGKYQIFPIQNPDTDELYIYSPNHQKQTHGLFELFVGVERPAFSNWLLQFGLAYSQASSYRSHGIFSQGADIDSSDQYTYNYFLGEKELLGQTKFMYSYLKKFYPYFLVGLGISSNKASDFSTNVPPFLTFTRNYQDNNNHSFAYKAGVGIDMNVYQHVRIGLGYRFSNLGHVSLGTGNIDGTLMNGTLAQTHLYANELLFQLTYII